jgi:hypothetical protein
LKKHYTYYLILFSTLLFTACTTKKNGIDRTNRNVQPNWVQQRPINNLYYVGIGYSNKSLNPSDYQQIAKKNALNDLIGEIKVVVSSHSILSQYQNDSKFSQIFATDTKVNSQAMVEGFQVMDSWENKNDFWIYYRLSKEEYEAAKKRKLQAAISQALDRLERADKLNLSDNFMQVARLRVKALAALQGYLNEDVSAYYNNNKVFLVNEIIGQLQEQLSKLQVNTDIVELKGKVGKPILTPFNANVKIKTSNQFVSYVPLVLIAEKGNVNYGGNTETDQLGKAVMAVSRVLNKDPIQQIKVSIDIEGIIKADSLNNSLKNILLNIDVPSSIIRLFVEPVKVFIQSQELLFGDKMSFDIIAPQLKRKLVESGCNFVSNVKDADYEVKINANTNDLGVMWGKMLQAEINMEISIADVKNNTEIYRDAIKGVRGFQVSKENAGKDAYNNMLNQFWEQNYKAFLNELLLKER